MKNELTQNSLYKHGWNAAIDTAIATVYAYTSFTAARELEKQLKKRKLKRNVTSAPTGKND